MATGGAPSNWDDYQYGDRNPLSRTGSNVSSRVHFEPSSLAVSPRDSGRGIESSAEHQNELRRRRSSLSMRIDSIRHAGGVNSIENFARSWQRAAGFVEVAPHRPSMVFGDDGDDEGHNYLRIPAGQAHQERTSLLRQQLTREESLSHGKATSDDLVEQSPSIEALDAVAKLPKGSQDHGEDIFATSPLLGSPNSAIYGTSYGALSGRVNEASMRHANQLWQEQQAAGVQQPDKERTPLLVRRVEREDGKIVNVVVGQSTMPQTVFNSINLLVGIGLLSLPLGMKYAGWLVGMIFSLFAAGVTAYTARILAKCLDVDGAMITFGDIAYVAFGPQARIWISILFSLELLAACVALVVLFADSLNDLVPMWGVVEWKVICGLFLIPLSFVPLRVLSFTSILGVFCCFGIIAIIFVDGFLKDTQPGSLRHPATTYLLPDNWWALPLSFGLLMSPYGGHSVMGNIYRDMRHPHKYGKAVTITYVSTYLLDVSMAVIGLLMFGEAVRDEITSNIFLTKGYPRSLSILMAVFISVIPITKIPLNARPIISTFEILSGLDVRAVSDSENMVGMSALTRGILKCTIRIGVTIVFVVVAIIFPSFDRIMALMGSFFCFTVSIILPCSFFLKIYGKEIPLKERVLCWSLIVSGAILGSIGTAWAFLPKNMIGL